MSGTETAINLIISVCITAGLYLIVRTSGQNHRRKGLGWILLVMADHFLYDSPIGEPQLFNALLTVAVVLPVILFFRSPEMRAEESEASGAA